MLKKIGSQSWSASGNFIVLGQSLPLKGPEGRTFLEKLILRWDFTSGITTGAGSAFATQELYAELLNNLTIEALDGYVGPKGLDGQDLAALNYLSTGVPLRFIETNGDTQIAVSQASQTRRLFSVYDWSAYGAKKSDFCAPCDPLAVDGRINITFGPANVDVSTFTGVCDVYVQCLESADLRAVPLIISERQGVQTLEGGVIGSGTMLVAALKKSTAFADGDITGLDLIADGVPLLSNVEPDWIYGPYGIGLDQATTKNQENFVREIGSTVGFYLPIHPMSPRLDRRAVGDLVYARQWTYSLRGAATAAALTWLVTRANDTNVDLVKKQLAACGCDMKKIEDAIAAGGLVSKTASKIGVEGPMVKRLPVKMRTDVLKVG